MKKGGAPKRPPVRFRVHEWYALVAIHDTRAGGFVWHQQCDHQEVPAAKETARKLIDRWLDDPQLFPMPLDDAFHHKTQQNTSL